MKKYLVNLKGGHMSAKLFREAREDFGLAHGDLLDIAEGDCEEYDEDCVIDKYCEPWYYFEPVVGYSLNEKYFAEKVMPIFAEILKSEIGIY